MREVIITSNLQEFDQENHFFLKSGLGSSGIGIALTFYTSVAKVIKVKVRKFLGLIPSFVEVTGEKLVGGTFLP